MDPLTSEEADILSHTARTGRYVGEGHRLMALSKRGLLQDHGPQALAGGAHYLTLTLAGIDALNAWRASQAKPVKPKRRSRQFAAWMSYCEANGSLSFPAFLKGIKKGHHYV